jgi:hypothetical protein
MKTFVLILLLLPLTGCSPAISDYQQVLDSYAQNAQSGELEQWLEGAALHEANQSQELLSNLGWKQVGSSRFSETRSISDTRVVSCLDVSEIRFVDSAGELLELERAAPRLLMQIDFSANSPLKIQFVEKVGSC